MKPLHAVITAAGRGQGSLPLQTIADAQGRPSTVLARQLEELVSAGIEQIGLVVRPGRDTAYLEAAGAHAGRLSLIHQEEPRGYGHAVWLARGFVGERPFVLMVGDHLYLSDPGAEGCVAQLLARAAALQAPVSSVQATHESKLRFFGAVGGRLREGHPGVYGIERVREKPSPTQAEQELLVPGMRHGHYLCFFGLHVFGPGLFALLEQRLRAAPPESGVDLTSSLASLASQEPYYAAVLQGRRFDLESRHGLLLAQCAAALRGPQRDGFLTQLVELLAQD